MSWLGVLDGRRMSIVLKNVGKADEIAAELDGVKGVLGLGGR